MKEFYQDPLEEREKKIKQIKDTLQQREEILFAYVFGSYPEDPVFRDIDVGVYLEKEAFRKHKDSYDYSFELASQLEEKIGSSPLVDVRVLNQASFQFLNSVFSRGRLILCRDEELLSNLIEKNSHRYLANAYFSEQSLRELANR